MFTSKTQKEISQFVGFLNDLFLCVVTIFRQFMKNTISSTNTIIYNGSKLNRFLQNLCENNFRIYFHE